MKYKILILAIMSALLVSCEKDFSEANPYQAIVEGYLHAGRTVTLNINRQKIFNSDDTTFVNPINDLVITFTDLTDNISE